MVRVSVAKWTRVLVGVSAVVLGLSGAANPRDASRTSPVPAALSTAVSCHDCIMCFSSVVHLAQDGTKVVGPNHGCMDVGGNPCPHAQCGGTLAKPAIEKIYAAIKRGDMQFVQRTLETDRRVVLNVQRSAIQIRGCDDNFIAHLPMRTSDVAMLVRISSEVVAASH